MNHVTSTACGHPVIAVGAEGSAARQQCQAEPCQRCADAIQRYREASEAHNVAWIAYQAAVSKYRSKEIGDTEYLDARKAWNAATDDFDAEYMAYAKIAQRT